MKLTLKTLQQKQFVLNAEPSETVSISVHTVMTRPGLPVLLVLAIVTSAIVANY